MVAITTQPTIQWRASAQTAQMMLEQLRRTLTNTPTPNIIELIGVYPGNIHKSFAIADWHEGEMRIRFHEPREL